MAGTNDYALPEVSTEQEYARQLEAAQLADRKRQVIMKNADRQRQKSSAQPSGGKVADKALEAISKSPAGANPWVRLVLILNNLLNRLTGKPPNSAENITIGLQVLTAVILILLLIQFMLVFSIVFFLINLAVNPGLAVQAALCQVFSSVLAFFGNTACTAN